VQHSVEVDGQTRNMLYEGFLFIHFPDERVVVSAHPTLVVDGWRLRICVRSNKDSAEFWRRWRDFAREHNYLRGQAFFADGEIIKRKRTRRWDDILLPEKTKRMVRTHVEDFLRHSLTLQEMGVKARRGLILAGPPGTGKTLLGKVLSDTLDVSFMWVSPRHVANAASFHAILTLARFVTPTVVFLEDLDLFAEERVFSSSIGLGELMNQLDGALDNENLITIATTNRLDVIEKALRNRPGRFDRVVEFEAMDKTCRKGLLKRLLAKASVSKADMGYIVQATDGYTGAQLEELSNTLYILAVRNDNTGVEKARSDKAPVALDRNLIDSALSEVHVERKRAMGFHVA
jgi:cell division protease FtsH